VPHDSADLPALTDESNQKLIQRSQSVWPKKRNGPLANFVGHAPFFVLMLEQFMT
jgi:hypothetical protein